MPEGRRNVMTNTSQRDRTAMRRISGRIVRRPITVGLQATTDGFVVPTNPVTTSAGMSEKSLVRQKSTLRPAVPRQRRSNVLARSAVSVKKSPTRRAAKKIRQHRRYVVWMFSAMMVFVSGSAASYLLWRKDNSVQPQVQVLSDATGGIQEGTVPDEKELSKDDIASYKVAPELPRILRISRLQIEARVRRLGTTPTGELKAPANINDAGWYDGSSEMGTDGTILINGHMHGSTRPGVFYRLGTLKEGDIIEIERGDGVKVAYSVVKTEAIEQHQVDMAKLLATAVPGRPGLNLLSHTDRYDVRTNKYEQRIVIYSVRQ